MTCAHNPRSVSGPGGEALLTANGNWTLYLRGRPGEVFRAEACPWCGTPLWGLPPEAPLVPVEGIAHARGKGV